jgi:hypothetical protein
MFYRSLVLGVDQTLVMEGDLHAMRRALGVGAALHDSAATETRMLGASGETRMLGASGETAGGKGGDDLVTLSEAFLCRQLSALLKLPAHKVDPRAPLEDYGIDSILALI